MIRLALDVMTEADLQAAVVDLARLLGWRTMHVRRSVGRGQRWTTATSVTGWPDVFAWYPTKGRALAIEFKSERGRVTPEQADVLTSLDAAGIPTAVVRPCDWPTRVRELLR